MRNKNTMGDWEYIWENLSWAVILFFLYRGIFFCPVFGWSYKLSLFFLAGVVMAGIGVGLILTWKRRRNYISLFTNIVSSYGIYFMISFWNINRRSVILTGVVAVVSVTAYMCLVFANYLRDRKRKRAVVTWGKCISSCLLSGRTLAASVLSILLISTAIKPMLGLPVMEAQADTVIANISQSANVGETIAENMDTILLLQEDQWFRLDASERLHILKTIADIEANYLGFPEVTVCTAVLEKNTLGSYDDSTRTITLNLSRLVCEDASTILETLCHECYHAYQHRLVSVYNALDVQSRELLVFYEASKYNQEFANYIDGNEDYDAYYDQWCETDSREYARDAAEDYFRRIEKYLANTATEEDEL